jgi:formylglycine-generating enzyme
MRTHFAWRAFALVLAATIAVAALGCGGQSPDTGAGVQASGGSSDASISTGGVVGSGGTTNDGAVSGSGGLGVGGSGGVNFGGTDGSEATDSGVDSGATDGSGGSEPPSCNGLAPTCGPSSNADCCASSIVTGGIFYRSYDGVNYADKSFPATVSDFRLDTYEITVGRFRKFVAGYPGNLPTAGAGKNANSPSDPGWGDPSWNASMPADQAALTVAVKCGYYTSTWTDSVAGNETLPMNCINWYEAFAFCIWDGGRLPTEAEWNYAAAGGSEQRAYPWSSPPTSTTIDDTFAVYCGGSCGTTQHVGLKSPKGDGRWRQADMAGNVFEWVLDWFLRPYPNPCNNCATTAVTSYRVFRGGSFGSSSSTWDLLSSYRNDNPPTIRSSGLGSRCARSAPSPVDAGAD